MANINQNIDTAMKTNNSITELKDTVFHSNNSSSLESTFNDRNAIQAIMEVSIPIIVIISILTIIIIKIIFIHRERLKLIEKGINIRENGKCFERKPKKIPYLLLISIGSGWILAELCKILFSNKFFIGLMIISLGLGLYLEIKYNKKDKE